MKSCGKGQKRVSNLNGGKLDENAGNDPALAWTLQR